MKNIKVKLKPIVKGINRVIVLKTVLFEGVERLFFATQIGEIFYLKEEEIISFLDIKDKVIEIDKTEERGFYGLAFHPNFQYNGLFYLHYSHKNTEGPGADSKDKEWKDRKNKFNHIHTVEEWIYEHNTSKKKRTLLNIRRPFGNHNGFNSLNFSPESERLVLTTGDGGFGYDPFNLSQDINEIAGKIIELDVDKDSLVDSKKVVTRFEELPDKILNIITIIAKGVRNISGVTYQKFNNQYIKYITNVGQGMVESIFGFIHYRPISALDIVHIKDLNQEGLVNFGWRGWEGEIPTTKEKKIIYYDEAIKILPYRIMPIVNYYHEDKRKKKFAGTAITGVRPYLGNEIPDLAGAIIFSDLKEKNKDPARGVLAYIKADMYDYEIIDVDYDFSDEDAYFVGLGTNQNHTRLFLTTYASNTMKNTHKGTIFEIIG